MYLLKRSRFAMCIELKMYIYIIHVYSIVLCKSCDCHVSSSLSGSS